MSQNETAEPAGNGPTQPEPLRSQHTSSFPEVLHQFGISLAVTTYQAGRLVFLRADQGVLNTHFRSFPRPMGIAVRGGRLAVGTEVEIAEFHNMPAVAPRLEPRGKHDACFIPRTVHCTGDIGIHEMAWVGDELLFVNTEFSCLCTRSDMYSFVPRWRPRFVTALAPEDRCHLNGLGVADGRVQYVTALGRTDSPGGWRDNKRDGGLLIDAERNAVVAEDLSMPHSPRCYDGKVWLLESGTGSIGTVDVESGRYEALAEFPGFTRGLAFWGPLAFVGLSEVRDSAIFSGFPLVERLEERTCGVWVVDIRNGRTVAWVKFEGEVQEIFGVAVLPGMRFPELIHEDREILASSYMLPNEALAEVPANMRSGSVGSRDN
jgi:uncharacterized protein (TIGR03032 family)